MSKRIAVALLAIALMGLGGWALAQQRAPAPKNAEAEAGRFAVSATGDRAVLLDTATGKTWLLRESADGRKAVWLPAERIDDATVAAKWQAEEEELRRELKEQRRKLEEQRRKAGAGDAP